jgi:hypothetical protein
MAEARAKGRGGWEDPAQCRADDLSRMLREHVEKGDPRDVANFCMMLHQRGEAIAASNSVRQEPVGYLFTDDPAVYAMPGSGFHSGKEPPANAINVVPVYDAPPAQAVDDRFPNGLSDAIEYANEMEEAASALYEKVFGHEDDGEDCGTVVMRRVLHHLTEQPAQAVDLGLQLDRYDAGLLGDGGGGDVGWWQDYIRTKLDRAHEFYQDQADSQAEVRRG